MNATTSTATEGMRVLIAIPAYNESGTIQAVVSRTQAALSGFDLLVVDDGSRDDTGAILRRMGISTATHLCNLGYGRAIQTAIKYALRHDYDLLITLDADGQHDPAQVRELFEAERAGEWDVLIGSRYIKTHDYAQSPLGRRLGMQLFSRLVRVITGRRIYDTTSGLKAIRRSAFLPLTRWHFIDFHAEAIVYLLQLGYRIREYPITVAERTQGQSMYSLFSHLTYPLQTMLMLVLGVVEARLTRATSR